MQISLNPKIEDRWHLSLKCDPKLKENHKVIEYFLEMDIEIIWAATCDLLLVQQSRSTTKAVASES